MIAGSTPFSAATAAASTRSTPAASAKRFTRPVNAADRASPSAAGSGLSARATASAAASSATSPGSSRATVTCATPAAASAATSAADSTRPFFSRSSPAGQRMRQHRALGLGRRDGPEPHVSAGFPGGAAAR